MAKLRRLLIDCSFIDFSQQPTGIPRVVLKYIEIGYAWGKALDIEVVPVVPTEEGVMICRPIPGRGAPPSLLAAAQCMPASAASPHTALNNELRKLVDDVRNAAILVRSHAAAADQKPAGHNLVPVNISSGSDTIHTPSDPSENLRPVTDSVLVNTSVGDLLFCPAYWHDVSPTKYQAIRANGAKIVILVHDILPIVFPRFYNHPWCDEFKRNVKAAFLYADAFCAVSVYTKNCLRELGFRERLPSVPIMTAYNGFDPLISAEALSELNGPRHLPDSTAISVIKALDSYYLMVGSIEPKKGHRPVIACFEDMWRAGLESCLVIIGRPGWLEKDAVEAIEKSSYFGTKLFWFSGIDDFELAYIYSRCRALVFASAGEGFGIPMIEAATYGRPIIAFNTPIVREILGDAALLFRDASEFVARIVAMEDDDKNKVASTTAASVAWPSWEDYTPRVYDALKAHFEGQVGLPDVIDAIVSKSSQ